MRICNGLQTNDVVKYGNRRWRIIKLYEIDSNKVADIEDVIDSKIKTAISVLECEKVEE